MPKTYARTATPFADGRCYQEHCRIAQASGTRSAEGCQEAAENNVSDGFAALALSARPDTLIASRMVFLTLGSSHPFYAFPLMQGRLIEGAAIPSSERKDLGPSGSRHPRVPQSRRRACRGPSGRLSGLDRT